MEDVGLVIARWGWWHATEALPQLDGRRCRAPVDRGLRRGALGYPRLWSVRAPDNEHLRTGLRSASPRRSA